MTSKSFCQTDTASDSLIILPKQIVLSMITDIKAGDEAKEEKEMLEEQLILQAQYVDQADSAIAYYKKTVAIWKNISAEKEEFIDTYKIQLDKTARELKKEKRWCNILKMTQTISTILLVIAL